VESSGTVLVVTVDDMQSKYSNRDYKQAMLARKIQNTIGRPSTRRFLRIVEKNVPRNCPIVRTDILAAEDIIGPNLGSIKGKTVRRGGARVLTEVHQIPRAIMEKYKDIVLCVNIMFVNQLPLFVTIGRNIKFGTVELLKNRKHSTILQSFKTVSAIYKKRGFRVTMGHTDGEFESMRGDLLDLGMELNVVSNDEHVPKKVERYIRTIKERTRCVYNTLPFKRIPSRMLVEMVQASVFWLNTFPPDDDILHTLSPRDLIVGRKIDFNKHCRIEYGTYAQVHEDHDNTMDTRAVGAIALRPTGNAEGGYFFFSLATGR
jgi:hypothetical protein